MNETTRRYPRTLHEAFNTDCDPISGPYGRQAVWPAFVIAFLIIIASILLVWSRI
jgi:hypothetical protein